MYRTLYHCIVLFLNEKYSLSVISRKVSLASCRPGAQPLLLIIIWNPSVCVAENCSQLLCVSSSLLLLLWENETPLFHVSFRMKSWNLDSFVIPLCHRSCVFTFDVMQKGFAMIHAYFTHTWFYSALRKSMLLHKSQEEDCEKIQASRSKKLRFAHRPFLNMVHINIFNIFLSFQSSSISVLFSFFPLSKLTSDWIPSSPPQLVHQENSRKSKMAQERVCHFQTAR